TDFDLSQHSEFSGKKLEYFDPQSQERYIPYVIETSIGLDRCIMMTLSDAYHEEEVKGEKRTVLKLHPKLAPVTVGIFPLTKKPELAEVALKLKEELNDLFKVEYDVKGSIGKRYRRLDEAGTPYCLTVDFDTLEDQCVTLRDRDSMEQKRISLSEVGGYINKAIANYKRV
ncbi:MAG: glycine--tRNA ligase, partial [Calditrichaeota bacterium]